VDKQVTVYLYGTIYTIDTNVPASERVELAHTFGRYEFAFYAEDKNGGLAYIYEPMCSGPRSLDRNLDWLKKLNRPAFFERFREVVIKKERTGEITMTLQDANLFDILNALKEIMSKWPLWRDSGQEG
jgi:hypothetical protein